MKRVIGIDPAMNGGIALLNTEDLTILAQPLPKIASDLDLVGTAELLREWCLGNHCEVYCEIPGIMNKSGVKQVKGMWGAYMGIKGILAAMGVRRQFVLPRDWQDEMLRGTQRNKRKGKRDKNKPDSVIVARQLYPDLDLSEYNAVQRADVAEACLVATYGHRKAVGALRNGFESTGIVIGQTFIEMAE